MKDCWTRWVVAWLTGCVFVGAAVPAATFSDERPNIVLVMIDDLGWPDLGCYGNDFVDTPHLDALARDGMRFTNFYAAGAVCSPTRCAIQSGQNQARIGITAHIPGHWRPFERVQTPQVPIGLPEDLVTLADSLKASGYTTGYIGKWHLNDRPGFSPQSKGYDFEAVINGPHYAGKYRVKPPAEPRSDNPFTRKPAPGQYRTDFEADLSIDFFRQHRDRPFFLMVSPFAVHIPLGAMSEKVERYRKKAQATNRKLPNPVYAAMIEHCDDMLGRMVAALDELKLSNKTMVIFTSDNGGLYRRYDFRPAADDDVASMAPLRGEKGTLYEGGIRVPLIIKYPGVAPAGSVCDVPAISYDFYPTCVAAAGAKLPEQQVIDGHNLFPLLDGSRSGLDREALHWHYPHYHHSRPASCIRAGNWKLIEFLDDTDEVELYRLDQDLGESINLAKEKPGQTARLKQQLDQWRTRVMARMPLKNPAYDPAKAPEWWSRKAGRPVDSDGRKRFPPTEKDL